MNKLPSLDDLARGLGYGLGYADHILGSVSHRKRLFSLKRYLKSETGNPIVARALAEVVRNQALNNGNSVISLEEAIQKISEDGHQGVVEVLGQTGASVSLGGGGPKCLTYLGLYEILTNEYHFNLRQASGVSGGAIPALFLALIIKGDGHGVDTSVDGLRKFSIELRDSLGIDFMEDLSRLFNKARYAAVFLRSQFTESLVDKQHQEAMRDVLDRWFVHLKMSDVPAFSTQTTHYKTGGRLVLNSETAGDELVATALAKTTAYPGLLPPVRDKGDMWTDGGYHGFFINPGNEFTILTILNYYIPTLKRDNFKWPTGKLDQRMQDHSIMESRNMDLALRNLTGEGPGELAKYMDSNKDIYLDPRGRFLLIMPNLSDVHTLDYFKKVDSLTRFGRTITQRALEKFLDPTYKHPKYDFSLFSPRR